MTEEPQTELGRRLDAEINRDLGEPEYNMYYDMEGRPCTIGRWAELFEDREPGGPWVVARTERGYVRVSTVWIGMDMGFLAVADEPLIYETMVFGGPCDGNQYRWPTRDAAVLGHQLVVRHTFRWWRNPEVRILAWWVGGIAAIAGLLIGLR